MQITDHTRRLAQLSNEVQEFHPILRVLLPKLPRVVDVEYRHGNGEMGADFVLQRKDDTFGDADYVGIIAKVGKVTQDHDDINRQIDECELPRLYFNGKATISLREIWIVSNDIITRNAQEKIAYKHAGKKIQFVDGPRTAKLVFDHIPDVWDDIDVFAGDYLRSLRTATLEQDRELSLYDGLSESFYVEQDVYRIHRQSYKSRKLEHHKVNILRDISERPTILIEGGMGAGKSKLTREVINHYAEFSKYGETKLLPLRTTFKSLQETHKASLESLIVSSVPDKVRDHVKANKSRYLVLIDAMDEVQSTPDQQAQVLISLATQARQAGNVNIVVTSRPLEFGDKVTEVEGKYSRYVIQPLTTTKVIEFIKRVCTEIKASSRILEDLKKSTLLKELPKSPIAAILLAKLINENSRDLPSNLTELYSKYIEFMLGRWDAEKGLQSRKEYEALGRILSRLAQHVMDNQRESVSIAELQEMFRDYLAPRNLEINPDALFAKMKQRCELVLVDESRGLAQFKHRSFAEFLYASNLVAENESVQPEKRAYNLYWTNTVFFYIGTLRDCPELLRAILKTKPTDLTQRWIRTFGMAEYLLAGFASPYTTIIDALKTIAIEAASLYLDIANNRAGTMLSRYSKMDLLCIYQMLMRECYSYSYFRRGIEQAVCDLACDKSLDKETLTHALFLLNVTYNKLGGEKAFDLMLEVLDCDLPVEIELAIGHETDRSNRLTALVRRQRRKFRKQVKGNKRLLEQINALYRRPIEKSIKKHSAGDT